jgi:hypothetical protein
MQLPETVRVLLQITFPSFYAFRSYLVFIVVNLFVPTNAYIYRLYIQGVYKRMVRFQKLTRNLFLTLCRGHTERYAMYAINGMLRTYATFAPPRGHTACDPHKTRH